MQKINQSQLLQKLFSIKFGNVCGRRLIFICIFTCFLLYYLMPFLYEHILFGFTGGSVEKYCIERHLKKVMKDIDTFDAVSTHFLRSKTNKNLNQIPFVGNGKIGALVHYDDPSLYVFYEKIETNEKITEATDLLRLPFSLLIKPENGFKSKETVEALVLNFRHGIVEQLTCFSIVAPSSGVIYINHTIVAHRSRPNVFLQHIEAHFEGKSKNKFTEDIILTQHLPETKDGFKFFSSNSNKQYKVFGGAVEVQQKFMSVVVAVSKIPSMLRIEDDKAHTDSISVILHSSLYPDKLQATSALTHLAEAISKHIDDVLSIQIDILLQEHKNAWADILHTGLSISHSTTLEPGIPHPLDINSTLYTVLSSMDSKLHDQGIPENERSDLMKRLQTPDFCYNDNPTLHAEKLWQRPKSVESIVELAKLWALTLKKSGCKYLVSEGAEGMLQAMVLSFGRLQFTESFLQVHADADILHNDIAFRGVMYKNNTLDIEMKYEKGTSSIEVLLKHSSKLPLYACEAGCASQKPIQITRQIQTLPVYITYPYSPILYISDSQNILKDIKNTAIMKEIVDHAQHIESKKEPGLPLLFWLGIGSSIVLFHLFLIRMIYKEYQNSKVSLPSVNRPYYSNRGRLAS